MKGYKAYYNAVDDIYSFLKRDLIGPVDELEVLENVEPLNTYACGILWPLRTEMSALETDESEEAISLAQEENVEEVEDIIVSVDDSIRNSNLYKPTSVGISLMLPKNASTLIISFSGAKYIHEEVQTEERLRHRFKRRPFLEKFTALIAERPGTQRCAVDDEIGFEVFLTVRNILRDGSRLITVTAQNIRKARQKGVDQSINAIFQCELVISSTTAFLPFYQNSSVVDNMEEKIECMQYRSVMNYAHGHGCSISYSETQKGVFTVISDFLPIERVYQMMPGEIKNKNILSLAYWENVSRLTACSELNSFIGEYAMWRNEQEDKNRKASEKEFSQIGQIVIARIDECILRLKSGIKMLETNDNALKAFCLMNRAMLLQRIKTKHVDEKDAYWYPFQLAYILQIIPDIVDVKSSFRESVDLLWFPTGGGKTEAYLGVAAFTIFYRRLVGKNVLDGVTIIMRYTLRLLTIQQFERATSLICACEYVRRMENLGGGEISIGLWIGSNMTPNRIEQAREALQKLRDNPYENIYEGNPVQITRCPWCGRKIALNGYDIKNQKMIIRCADNETCEFHNGLPIYVVDEDIYRERPTLLISTIDKFARIAWEENSRYLFGEGTAPPELIIQDELHLISGPLGSLSGIYEIAIEYLCERGGRRSKIIASTATVKNAEEQIRNLYNRKYIQFPPAGIDYDDSFFAVKADADQRPARTYIGLCEMGGSIADLLIRVYAVLFFAKALFIKQGRSENVIDQYFTTVGYFNALKDLGATSTIIQDRIFTHIRNLIARTFKKEADTYQVIPADVRIFESSELTSRKTSREIKDTLELLTLKYNEPGSYSYVLASNMLSVGIDIDRLGVMTVYNQPKSNAEYIQATSRVGRRYPGIVLTMYNNMRSRDKSHYEQFGYYHKSFYRYVEATSVTPFSLRAMEKALHCVFVALVRLTIPSLSGNETARYFSSNVMAVQEIRDYIIGRVEEIMPKNADEAIEMLNSFMQDWEEVARENRNTLCYRGYNGLPSFLVSAEEDSGLGIPKILNSLRNVDYSVNIYFRR